MERFVGIGEAAKALGVSITTLRRWEAAGRLSAEHTAGGHRRYDLAKLRPEMFRAEYEAIRPRWPPQTAPLMAGQTAPGRTGGL